MSQADAVSTAPGSACGGAIPGGAILCAAILVALWSGCAPPPSPRAPVPPPHSEARPPRPPPPAPAAPEAPPLPERAVDSIEDTFLRGEYRRVIERYQEILQRYPSHRKGADDLYYLGSSYYAIGLDRDALAPYLEMVNRFPADPRSPEVLVRTGEILAELGRRERAIEYLRRAGRITRDGVLRGRARRAEIDLLVSGSGSREDLARLDELYSAAAPAEAARLEMEIDRLLASMEPAWIGVSVIPGTFSFPKDVARRRWAAYLESRGERRAARRQWEILAATTLRPAERERAERALARLSRAGERPVRRIGVLVPREGRLAAYGEQVKRGVDLFLAGLPEDGPVRIEAIVRHEGDDPAAALRELAGDASILAVIGPLLSSSVEAVVPEAEDSGLPLLSPAASSPRLEGISPYFFRNSLTLEVFGASLAAFAVDVLGLSRFAVLAPDEAYGHRFRAFFTSEVEDRGGTIVFSQTYDPSLTDFGEPIRAMREALVVPDPLPEDYDLPLDAVFLPGYPEQVGLIVPQLAFHDIDVRDLTVLGGSELNTERFARIGEEYAEGVFFPTGFFAGSPRPEVQHFTASYVGAYGETPGTLAAQAYDAACILSGILQDSSSRGEVRDRLGQVSGFAGVTGRTTLEPGGRLARDPFFVTVARGRLVSLTTVTERIPAPMTGDGGGQAGPHP